MEKHTTSTSRIVICLMTILILGAPTAQGKRLKAKIEFAPGTVVPIVTLRLGIKCTLVPADPKDEDGVIDVKSVAGVNINKKKSDGDFETVASVSYTAPDDPKLHGNWDNNETAIDAHLDDNSRLLEVTVTDPTVEHTGDMQCEIVVNDEDAAVKTLSIQDTIVYQDPNMTTFVNELRRLKLRDEAQQQEIVSQKKEITDLKAKESTKVSFCAVRDNGRSSFYEEPSSNTDLVFNRAFVNQGGGYDTSTGVFTCPVAGIYYLRYDLQMGPLTDLRTSSGVYLLRNGAPVTWSTMANDDPDSRAWGVIGAGLVLQLKKGDKLKVRTSWMSENLFYWKGNNGFASMFTGFLIK